MESELHPLEKARRRARERGDLRSLITTDFHAAGLRFPEECYHATWRRWRDQPGYDGSGRGSQEARELLAAAYRRDGAACERGDLLLTAGSSISYHLILSVLARQMTASTPGGRPGVLLPRPGYPLFDGILAALNIEALWYDCRPETGFVPDPRELSAVMERAEHSGDRPLALVLISPNNPAGVCYPADRLRALIAAAQERDVPVILDAVFSLFRSSDEPQLHVAPDAPSGTAQPLLIELQGVSKLCAAPELKLGWIRLIGGEPEQRAALAEELDTAHDTYLSLSGFAQAAVGPFVADAAAWEARRALRAELGTRRAALTDRLAEIEGLEAHRVTAGIHVPVRLDPVLAAQRVGTVDDEVIATRLLAETGVYLHPGSFYGLDQPRFSGAPWLVMSCLPGLAEQMEMLSRVAAWLGAGQSPAGY